MLFRGKQFFLIEMNPSIYKFHFVFTYIIGPQSQSVECA
jgi:hypothetical protein